MADFPWSGLLTNLAATALVVLELMSAAWAVGVWGLRLAGHIHLRNRRHAEDPPLRPVAGPGRGDRARAALVRIYLLPGVAMWFVSGSVQLGQYGRGNQVLGGTEVFTVIGVVVWLVGFGFETVGDRQLARFRADPANRGKVLDTGLWRYTRHRTTSVTRSCGGGSLSWPGTTSPGSSRCSAPT